MAELSYSGIVSLDGYVADADGDFDWSAPDDEVHAFVNDLERPVGTYLYGSRMYGVMSAWEGMDLTGAPPEIVDFATVWRAADKIVYSKTLDRVHTERTRLERAFDPDGVRRLKESAESPLSVGGPTIAAHALEAGLVDRVWMLVNPIVVGGGTRFLPDGLRLDLDLVDEHRFGGGVVYLAYAVRG